MSSGFTKLTFIIKLIYFTFFLSLKKKRKCIHNDIQNNLVSLKLSQESMIFRTIDRIVYMVQYCKYIFHLRFLLICRWVSQLISFEERKKMSASSSFTDSVTLIIEMNHLSVED